MCFACARMLPTVCTEPLGCVKLRILVASPTHECCLPHFYDRNVTSFGLTFQSSESIRDYTFYPSACNMKGQGK